MSSRGCLVGQDVFEPVAAMGAQSPALTMGHVVRAEGIVMRIPGYSRTMFTQVITTSKWEDPNLRPYSPIKTYRAKKQTNKYYFENKAKIMSNIAKKK